MQYSDYSYETLYMIYHIVCLLYYIHISYTNIEMSSQLGGLS